MHTRHTKAILESPIDRMAMAVAMDKLSDLGWNAATIEAITPYSDGSVRIEGREWHTTTFGNPTPYVLTASANGYTEVI